MTPPNFVKRTTETPNEIKYVTNFKDNFNDNIIIYFDKKRDLYTDHGNVAFGIDNMNDQLARLFNSIAESNNCLFSLNNQEFITTFDTNDALVNLIQTIIICNSLVEYDNDYQKTLNNHFSTIF